MKFIRILFNLYRNGEFLQLMKNILNVINLFDIAILGLTNRVATFSEGVQALNEAFQPQRGEELSSELKTLDTRRDKSLMGIKLFLQSCLYREEEAITKAATMLLENYESHAKRMDKLPYQQETAVVNSFIKDLENNTELTEALDTVALSSWVALLKELNLSFDNTYVDRAKTITESAGIEDKRKTIKDAFTNLADDIEAYARISENKEAYVPIITAINGLIEDYNLAVQSRFNGTSSTDDVIIEDV